MMHIDDTEADTREEIINPALESKGWGKIDGSRIRREFPITDGRKLVGNKRGASVKADYILIYKNQIIGVVEAKKTSVNTTEGVQQAKDYARLLDVRFAYATNGKTLYQIDMHTKQEHEFKDLSHFPTPETLWETTYPKENQWRDEFCKIPFHDGGKKWTPRYYQENAINRALEAIADDKDRILLTLATGTGKTAIAFQIVWKLFHAKWSLSKQNKRLPRVLFLADRNVLANQAFNSFSAFKEDALVRINAKLLRKTGKHPTNGSIFFTIFQTFMIDGNDDDNDDFEISGDEKYTFHGYPRDFFDLVIVDECHRGGAKDESSWRKILEHFEPAVQIGLTATPKREKNVDTYDYFGEPVYKYSLKEGIQDGFLTPYRVRKFNTTLDEYIYSPDDEVVQGDIDTDRVYSEQDFNRIIEMDEREKERVRIFLNGINPNDKTLVFCATQEHAGKVRDYINQISNNSDVNYCVRVTANDGETGEEYLRNFQDTEKSIPTILTTSQKLSTGVDARQVKNIVLMRPVNSMIEFKQIIGRGTRLSDNKDYFTIYDFVNAHFHFQDPIWDGEPDDPEPSPPRPEPNPIPEPPLPPDDPPPEPREKIKVKLAKGKEREIQHMESTLFNDGSGNMISAVQYIQKLYGELPALFEDEAELRKLWGNPETRQRLIEVLSTKGFAELENLIEIVGAEHSDLFDVLAYIAYDKTIIARSERVRMAESDILSDCNPALREFLEFIMVQYEEEGVSELATDKLADLIKLKYGGVADAQSKIGVGLDKIKEAFFEMQEKMYQH